MNFKDKTVIVTGGGRGTGKGITEEFLRRGANVIICGRRQPNTLPGANGKTATFLQADIRDAEQATNMINETVRLTGRLDILINNAGGGPPVDSAKASPRLTESIIKLNLLAPLLCSQAAYKAIIETAEGGSIVSIASVSAIRPSPRTVAYGAAKAGLLNMTRSLAMEWAPQIRVNAIIAGLIKTEASKEHYGGSEGIKRIEEALPMRRMATPEDIAKVCIYLSSEEARYISGASIEVHGGGEPLAFHDLAKSDN